MDLSWCIICDNRIDDVMTESSLYCSASCQGRDQSYSSITGCQEHNNTNYNNSIQQVGPLKNIVRLNKVNLNGPSPTSSTSSSRTKRPNAPSTSYPWELLYTRPRNKRHLMVKRCQPMVASSFTTATALFAPKPSMV
ncbi:hypothetical protein BCR42DRAFT_409113 [Absidia repens]|uniref:Uncharacterized protein n=1 Tax=Absidia repens TaxID=90262 RepID=A0A1X2IQP6_9FUNG|nr:hypothetical protein BCR42DRAFT_409113 [Absidia repens]